MDGVFINLTDQDIIIKNNEEEEFVIPKNIDLVTPIKEEITTDLSISGIISSPLSEMDIKFLQTAKFTNSTHLKISRSEKDILVKAKLISPFEKYSFTKEQIEKINNISSGRPRLLILTPQDAEFWSKGFFQPPFRTYRLFSVIDNQLYEYPVPASGYFSDAISKFKSFLI